MLLLSRRRDEVVVIDGGRIVVRVIDIRGDHVRLGIDAPKHIPVNRGEIQDIIDRELADRRRDDARGEG